MSTRFRYLAADGREIEIATTEGLLAERKAGRLTEDTLLYDAEGGGWAPARSHTVFMELDESGGAFTLAEEEALDPETTLASLRREREEPRSLPVIMEGLTGPEADLSRPPAQQRRTPGDSSPATAEAPDGQWAREASPTWTPPVSAPRRRRRAASGLVRMTAVGLVGLGGALGGWFLLGDYWPLSASAAGSGGPESGEISPEEIRAMQGMVADMQGKRWAHRVERVPSDWLEGFYLADAHRFPEVRSYWVRYETYVREMQATEAQLYRENLVSQLVTDGANEATVAIRLARALRTFESDRPRRDSVYHAMLDVSTAAVALHDLLAENEADIVYEPAMAGLSREPITEAVTDDPMLQASMNALLDRIFNGIEMAERQPVGPRDRLPSTLQRGLTPPGAMTLP